MNKVCVCTCGVPTPSSIVTWMSATGLSKIKNIICFCRRLGCGKPFLGPGLGSPLYSFSPPCRWSVAVPSYCHCSQSTGWPEWRAGVHVLALGWRPTCRLAVVSFSSRNLLAFVLRFVIYSLLQSCWWQVGKCWGEPKRNTKRTLTNGVRIWRCVRWRRYSVTGWNGLSFRPHTWRMGSWQAAQHSSTGSSWQSRLENCRWANVSDSVTAVYTQPPAFVDLRTTNEPGQLR